MKIKLKKVKVDLVCRDLKTSVVYNKNRTEPAKKPYSRKDKHRERYSW